MLLTRATTPMLGVAGAIAISLAACAPPRRPTPEARPVPTSRTIAHAPLPEANPKLPPVPQVEGPLHISVVYPKENALIASRDSNFIFGSVGNGRAGLKINGVLVPVWPNGAFLGWLPNPPADAQRYELVAYTETDTARLTYPVRTLAAQPPAPVTHDTIVPVTTPQYAELHDDSLERAVDDTDRVIIGRPSPTGTYKWFLFPGTAVRVTGYLADMARVALDEGQEIWVARRSLRERPAAEPLVVTGNGGHAGAEGIDVTIRVANPPAYVVDEAEQSLTLTVYNVTGSAGMAAVAVNDPYIRSITKDLRGTRLTYHIELTRPVFGYLATYRDGMMTFRIRRPPTVDPTQPLRGMTIVVDPGHPPAGATGPTGLYEPVPTLAVGFRVRDLLTQRGARVIMTRTTPDPVALGDRPIMARRANADALVSIHLNALPDGMNPFRSEGTGTYYFHTHSKRFASLVQESLVAELGLRDLGTFRENLALARPTWFPAVLTEGVFIILPDQEAAIRTPQYQDAYARGIVNGLERFFATWR